MTTTESAGGPLSSDENSDQTGPNAEKLNENLLKLESLSQRILAAMAHKKPINPALEGPGQNLMIKAATAYMTELMQNPGKLLEHQVSFWGESLKRYAEAQTALASGQVMHTPDEAPQDHRFANPLWSTHPYFNYIRQQYQLNAEMMTKAVENMDGLDPSERKRVEYFTQQIVDMLSPTNFLSTNPDALEKAVATDGASLVQGLENLVADLEANEGDLLVTLADRKAFKVGENIGMTEGSVVYRNRMFELIQYKPTTETVHQIPLIIFPPWINKFYIMDLKEQNSLIKWIVDQGITLFVVSWVNPDASYRDVGLETYIEEGYLTAFEQAKQICEVPQVNAVGYCIAGTTLSLTLALLKKRGDTSVKSATFFTTLTDFEDQGEFSVFLTDDFVDGIEAQVKKYGYLDSYFMSRTFSFLRSNDLIYKPAIKSYMLGEAPPAFDLLFWNGDSTNLPARMAVEYLRWLCQDNQLSKGQIELFGQTLSLKDVTVPTCAIACETDHIAAWKSSYDGVAKMGSRSKTFILSESGHIAGIINPPSKKKYGHYTNGGPKGTAQDWLAGAQYNEGSWWPTWGKWLATRSGKKVTARIPGDSSHSVLCSAPGIYVGNASGD